MMSDTRRSQFFFDHSGHCLSISGHAGHRTCRSSDTPDIAGHPPVTVTSGHSGHRTLRSLSVNFGRSPVVGHSARQPAFQSTLQQAAERRATRLIKIGDQCCEVKVLESRRRLFYFDSGRTSQPGSHVNPLSTRAGGGLAPPQGSGAAKFWESVPAALRRRKKV